MQFSKDEKIKLFRSLFRGRDDVFARRWERWDGGVSGYAPVYTDWKKKDAYAPLTDEWIEKHLLGTQTIGVYPLLTDNTSYFIAADFDGGEWLESCKRFSTAANKHNLPVYVERSRSGKGGHVWCFFEELVPAFKSRQVLFNLLRESKNISEFDKDDSFDRLFPNQDYLSGKGLGNLVALPLQGRSRNDGNSIFLERGSGSEPATDQWTFVASVERVSADALNALWTAFGEANEQRDTKPKRMSKNGEMRILFGNYASIPKANMTPQIANFLRTELNFLNAEYIVKQRMGLATYNLEKYFKTIVSQKEAT